MVLRQVTRATNRKVEQGQATRGRLVATAARLFAERGYDATPIELVLQEAEVSRGALYHHFPSKEALFEAVLESVEVDVGRTVQAAAREAQDPVLALRLGSLAWLRLARDPVVRQIVLVDAPAVLGWERWRAIEQRYALGQTRATLQAAAAMGRIDADLVETLAQIMLAASIEVSLIIARAEDPVAATATCERVVDVLVTRLFGE
jgi:AcrR family transcriptional regulator